MTSLNYSHLWIRVAALTVAGVFLAGFVWLPSRSYASTSTSTPTTTPNASVSTGDASAESNTKNAVNTNTTIITGQASTTGADMLLVVPKKKATTTEATTTDVTASTTPADASLSHVSTTTVASNNTASTTNKTTVAANTGGNTASSGGSADVLSGNAYASANAINIINTNIVNSTGLLEFSNLFSSLGIDLRGLNLSYFTTSPTSAATSSCSLNSCSGGNITVTTSNIATTTNTVSVVANTGNNAASSGGGSATVATGNAYASGNSVNLVNTNIIKSNYLLVGINNFGNLGGDVVLPGAAFFKDLLARNSSVEGSTSVINNNIASVTNSTAANASTGNNNASSGGGGAAVITGDALSSATTINQVNTNQIGGTSIFFLFRIWGAWNGTVRGLPPGMTWRQTPEGVELTNTNGSSASLNQLLTSGNTAVNSNSTSSSPITTASTTNLASLNNKVSVYALTGNNESQAAAGTSTVTTGNAYAAANTVNIVNTNLIGHNWIYAIFNIFGNLNGDIAFGHPDLWLGATAQTGNPTLPGSPVTFHFTVANRGDAVATNVQLSANFLKGMLNFSTGTTTNSSASWNLGTIPVGQVEEFTYTAQAGSVPPGDSIAVPLVATVTSAETNNNPNDNTDSLTIVITNPNGGSGGTESFTSDPKISVVKTADTTATSTPATVNYLVDITNNGGPAYNAVATDVLTNSTGAVMNTQSWNLDTINYQDEIKIAYSAVFSTSTSPGNYTNTVTVTGLMHYPNGPGSVAFPPVIATRVLTILPPVSSVSPPLTAPECVQYLTSYLKPGAKNNVGQVRKLQEFLRSDEAENSVSVTGVYDTATIAAVKRFQQKYASNILAPWGYNKPTGIVYYTTQKQINDIWCSGTRSFGLTQSQLSEIAATRQIIKSLQATITRNHTSATSTATSTRIETATSTVPTEKLTLPPGIEVGMASTSGAIAPQRTGSWLSWVLGMQHALLANVLNAFTSVKNVVAFR